MLSVLLDSVKTAFGSQGFFIAGVFPVVLFTAVNALLAARAWPSFAAWLGTFEALAEKTVLAAAILAVMLVAAYLLSSFSSAILEMFEGRRGPAWWFAGLLHRVQLARLRELEGRYRACYRGLDQIVDVLRHDPTANPPVIGWPQLLISARRTGWAMTTCTYSRPQAVQEVLRLRELGLPIPRDVLGAAMTRLLLFLQTNKADSRAAEGTDARILDHDCDALKEAIYFSRDKYQAERIRLYNLRKFNFPDDADAGEDASTILLAPTALGNVARTAHRYAEDTYCFDLDVLWTRLDQALRTSDPFYKTLENAKVQLDFYVACASLAWITTAAWLLLHLALLRSVVDFVIIGVVGPLVAHGAYELACRAYKVFADVMRTGVDLFRFKVLTDLHLPLPLGLEEERIAWLTLANVMGYQNLQAPDGSSASFTYKHPA